MIIELPQLITTFGPKLAAICNMYTFSWLSFFLFFNFCDLLWVDSFHRVTWLIDQVIPRFLKKAVSSLLLGQVSPILVWLWVREKHYILNSKISRIVTYIEGIAPAIWRDLSIKTNSFIASSPLAQGNLTTKRSWIVILVKENPHALSRGPSWLDYRTYSHAWEIVTFNK